nr:MAG TPA: hypothetical protein [Caudoviricetes sp.]
MIQSNFVPCSGPAISTTGCRFVACPTPIATTAWVTRGGTTVRAFLDSFLWLYYPRCGEN